MSSTQDTSLLATLGQEKYERLMHLIATRAAMIATGNEKLAKKCHDFAVKEFGGEAMFVALAEFDEKKQG